MKNEKRLILPNQTLPVNLHLFFVPRTRLELAHRNRHQPLKLACLPISPSGQSCKDKIQKLKVKNNSQFSSLCLESFTLRLSCAQNRTRTCTSLLTLVPETSASTNFALWAFYSAGTKIRKNLNTSICGLYKSIFLLPDNKRKHVGKKAYKTF